MSTNTREPLLSAPYWMKCPIKAQRRANSDDNFGFKEVNYDELLNHDIKYELLKGNRGVSINGPSFFVIASFLVLLFNGS